MAKKEYNKEDVINGKAYGLKKKEQLDIVKKSFKKEPNPIAFTDSFEDKLRESLFEQEIIEIQKKEEEKINNPDFERSGYSPKVEKKPGLWDYVKEDEITFFDPNYSYELTGYKPINDKEGLDFDPTPFREAGIIFETTGAYCEFPKDCKPYIDF